MIVFHYIARCKIKFNAPKCGFGLKDIPYLDYAITQ